MWVTHATGWGTWKALTVNEGLYHREREKEKEPIKKKSAKGTVKNKPEE